MLSANEKVKEICFPRMNINFKTLEDMICQVQSSEGKTKLKFLQSISDQYDQKDYMRQSKMFQHDGDVFSEVAQF